MFHDPKIVPFKYELDELKSKVWEGLENFEILGFLNGSMSSPPSGINVLGYSTTIIEVLLDSKTDKMEAIYAPLI